MKVIVINNISERILEVASTTAYGPFPDYNLLKEFLNLLAEEENRSPQIYEYLQKKVSKLWLIYPVNEVLIDEMESRYKKSS